MDEEKDPVQDTGKEQPVGEESQESCLSEAKWRRCNTMAAKLFAHELPFAARLLGKYKL